MLCPSCHTQNRENARFCKGCGYQFSMQTAQDTPMPDASDIQEAQGTQRGQETSAVQKSSGAPEASVIPATQMAGAGSADNGSTPDMTSQANDPDLAPTQVLSPQAMMEMHTRRWHQEVERESADAAGGEAQVGQTEAANHAEPTGSAGNEATALASSPGNSGAQASYAPQEAAQDPQHADTPDVSDLSTVAMSSGATHKASGTMPTTTQASETSGIPEAHLPPPPPPAGPQEDVPLESPYAQAASAPPVSVQPVESTGIAGDVQGVEVVGSAAPSTTAQAISNEGGSTSSTGGTSALNVGTIVGGRYELTQVLSEGEHENVYHVVDHQGYQHCWNCGSEQNAEGDEFCIDCGAELLNASYVMHEYPASESKGAEADVLQGVIVNTLVEQGKTYVIEQPQAAHIAFPNGVHLLAASDSDAGNVRRSEPNEDSTLVLQFQRVHESYSRPTGVYIVADGMGGHDNGQGASRMTIGVISEHMMHKLLLPALNAEKSSAEIKMPDEATLIGLFKNAVEEANNVLCQVNQREKSDMGSTITGFMVVGDHAYIINVGDSRTYMLREGKLYQLTNDHSLVGQLVAGGMIEPDDVYTHPQRSQIFRSLGDKMNVQIDDFKQQLQPGDTLLSCSDGLWEMVRNPQITEILSNAPDPQTACTQLLEAANENGGEDNVSAVVVFVR